MAEKIKKFFAKKKADAKFKLAGPGRRLDQSSTTIVGPSKPKKDVPQQRSEPSDANRQAAEAALARLQQSSQRKDTAFNTSLAAIQVSVLQEKWCLKRTRTHLLIMKLTRLLKSVSCNIAFDFYVASGSIW